MALVTMHAFREQITQFILDTLQKEEILLSRVSAGMTHIYEILDLTVNGYPKRFMKVRQQLVESKEVKIEVKLTLTTLKPIHTKWLVDFYNHMTTPKGEKVVSSGWSTAGITNALKNGETCLESLDLFADIDPLVSEQSVNSKVLQID